MEKRWDKRNQASFGNEENREKGHVAAHYIRNQRLTIAKLVLNSVIWYADERVWNIDVCH